MLKPFALSLVLLGAAAGALRADALNVSAAVSLGEALEQVTAAYTRRGGTSVRLNLGGSNTLARQIISGAPVDVFISADEAQMDLVERAAALAPGTRIDLLRNQLAIVTSPRLATVVTGPGALVNPSVRRIAVGEPTAVPAGVYARQYLERIGIWAAVAAKLVPTTSVRAALSAVDAGAADAAIVYVTDAAAARSARIAFKVPEAEAPPIVYPAAVAAGARNKTEAARFLSFLRGAEATAIFRAHGFLPIAAH